MKFNLKDFIQLDTDGLLAVNGGSPCAASPSSSPSSDGDPGSGGSGGGGGSSGGTCGDGSGGNGGGSCGKPTGSPTNHGDDTDGGDDTYPDDGDNGVPEVVDEEEASDDDGNSDASEPEKIFVRDNGDGTHVEIIKNGDGTGIIATVDNETGEIRKSQPYQPADTNGGSGSGGGSGDNGGTGNDAGSDTVGGSGNDGGTTGTDEPGSNGITDTLDTSSLETHSDEGSSATGTGSTPGLTTGGSGNNGGNCGGNSGNTIPRSGKFGQITDGSYADKLTMQIYKNNPYKYQPNLDEKMNGDGYCFSKKGCLMTAVAKLASEISGKEIDPYLDVNQKIDKNKDGKLSVDEISNGLNSLLDDILGDIFDVTVNNIEDVNLSDLQNNISDDLSTTTYVLGFAPDCYGGHWVVLEGYNVNTAGKVSFTYDGTSDNDNGRSYILGTSDQNTKNNVFGITRIETVSITRK